MTNNNLTGEIPPFICNITRLKVLNLYNNKLTGTIPPCLLKDGINLQILNLRGNQFHGAMPHEFSPKCELQTINLKDNQLEGLLPRSLSNCRSLKILDLGNNNLKDTFPYWEDYQYVLTIMNKGQLMTLEKYFAMLIDFSNNHFEGEIPSIIEQFVYLQVLNISQNYLTNEIPPELGNLVRLESLDLSRNYLSGKIPQKFVSLHFLSYFNLSYNKLVGIVPEGGQLCTFTNTSFEGNEGLQCFCCNKPVLATNNTTTSPPSLGDTSPSNRNYMIVLGILFGVGFGGSMAAVLVLDVLFYNNA
ncbi:Receptor-like protein 12 [Dendrobium catenatum]|uniref:Receptor-like protein 12 n=1 Tax=Dendrobium catenatum TaxID=906689 RepID=A0A2I0WA14_9ASPA|nr:Receptor-like protein 12 [Dendrobium catenatum]